MQGNPTQLQELPLYTRRGIAIWFQGVSTQVWGGSLYSFGGPHAVWGPCMVWRRGLCGVWGSLDGFGVSPYSSGSPYGVGLGGSVCGLGVPVQLGGVPLWVGVPIRFWGSLYSWGVPVRYGGDPCTVGSPCIYLGGPCVVRGPRAVWGSLYQFGGPLYGSESCTVWGSHTVLGCPWEFRGPPAFRGACTVLGVPVRFGVRVPRPPPNPAVGEPSPPAGVAVAPRGGGLAGRGGSRLFRRRVVSAQRRRHSGSRSRERRGPARFVPAMWFIYALSWLSLLIQVAFVTLAIGERHRRGGWGGFGACGGAAARGLGPASGSSRGLSRYVVLCVGEGVAPGRGQLGILLGAISGPRVQHIPGA